MVTRKSSPRLLSALGILVACSIQQVAAIPFPHPKNDLRAAGFGYLLPRQCDNPCGMDHQYCCEAGSTCFTTNGIAGCSAAAGGGYAIYTTTWTQTATYTSTISSIFPAATGNGGADCVPPPGSGQKPCGSICCASWQYCAYAGQCMANGAGGLNPSVSSGGPVTTQFSAPYRVTSGVPTGTNTGIAGGVTTTGGVTPGGAEEDDGGGLSAGAIAGIVIGAIAGLILLLLLCACCIVRGLWHGVMAVLGLGKKREKETIIEEERYGHSRRDSHGGWYGGGGRPSTVASRKEKKSSGKGLLGLGAALGTLWLLLGLRKDKKKKSAKTRSDLSSSYWSSSSYTADSPSSLSSDRRTRRSHRSARTGSRVSRVTRTTRVSRVPSRGPSPRSPRSPPR